MPVMTITTRYGAMAIDGGDAEVKKAERNRIKKNYEGAKILSQKIITDGIPDAVQFGDLKSQNQIAVRSEVEVSQAVIDKSKAEGRRI